MKACIGPVRLLGLGNGSVPHGWMVRRGWLGLDRVVRTARVSWLLGLGRDLAWLARRGAVLLGPARHGWCGKARPALPGLQAIASYGQGWPVAASAERGWAGPVRSGWVVRGERSGVAGAVWVREAWCGDARAVTWGMVRSVRCGKAGKARSGPVRLSFGVGPARPAWLVPAARGFGLSCGAKAWSGRRGVRGGYRRGTAGQGTPRRCLAGEVGDTRHGWSRMASFGGRRRAGMGGTVWLAW